MGDGVAVWVGVVARGGGVDLGWKTGASWPGEIAGNRRIGELGGGDAERAGDAGSATASSVFVWLR